MYRPSRAALTNAPAVAWLLLLVLAVALQTSARAQDASVRAELSASVITRDESVTLTITATGIDAEMDASALDRDFDVIGRSSSRQISTVIGPNNRAVNTSVITWTLELMPRGKGVFTVPAVKVGDLETQLLTLTVNEVPAGALRDVFLEASVDTETPWVQSQVLMTLKVFQAIEIIDGALDIPTADDLVVERLGDDRRERVTRDGREYSVTERRFAMFPQKSGVMVIDPVTLSVTVPAEPDRVRGFFSPTRKLTRRSEPITLRVRARPPSGGSWWLPATGLTLSSQWQGDPNAAQTGQPLTRTLVMRATGVLESQLPEINIPAVDGISLYAEDPVLNMGGTASGLVAEQRVNWAVIPQTDGSLTLPAIRLEWFNILTGATETAELPEETITVLPATSAGDVTSLTTADAVDSPPSAAPDGSENLTTDKTLSALSTGQDSADGTASQTVSNLPADGSEPTIDGVISSMQRWQLVALVAIGLWSITLLGWYVAHRRYSGASRDALADVPAHSGAAKPRDRFDSLVQQLVPMSQIDKACKQGDLRDIKRSLLEWGARQWPTDAPSTLDQLQDRLGAGPAQHKLSVLQSALYSQQGSAGETPALAADMASLPSELKQALQQNTGSATSDAARTAPGGRSRLPGL